MKKIVERRAIGLFLAAMILILPLAACQQASPDENAAAAATPGQTSQASETPAASGIPNPKAAEPVELTVFAAASMTETMQKVAELYRKIAPNVTITYNFDSSGTLKTQIQEGAECDLFISAAPKQMNQLDSSKTGDANPDNLDFIEHGTHVNLLENKVALVVSGGNPKNIKNFDDMIGKLKAGTILLAMGNSDVPVGQYTQKILTYYKLDEKAIAQAGSITYGSNVKEVTSQVAAASVDCGVVYGTDAYSAKLTVMDTATAEMCGQVIYPAAVLKISKNKEAAIAFLDYLKTDDCMRMFKAVGFSPAS